MNAVKIEHTRSVAVLAYHSIDDSGSVLSTPPRVFAKQMRILSELGADIVSVKDIKQSKSGSDSAKPMIAITFDDGFRNVYEHAFPVLQRHGYPATVFLVTDYCGRTNAWPSQPAGMPRQPLLDWQQIKEMSNSEIDFGSHTRTHPDLTTVSDLDAEEEIVGSKSAIEEAIGQPVSSFAYPYGSMHDRVKSLARAHFALACSTSLGFVHPGSDLFALERLDMYYFRRLSLLRNLFSPAVTGYTHVRRMMRDLRARVAAAV